LTLNQLLVSNTWVRFSENGFTLTVSNDVMIAGAAGRLDIGGNAVATQKLSLVLYNSQTNRSTFSVGGNLTLAAGSQLWLYSVQTNATTRTMGGLISVTQTITVASNAWICPVSHLTNGGSPLIHARISSF